MVKYFVGIPLRIPRSTTYSLLFKYTFIVRTQILMYVYEKSNIFVLAYVGIAGLSS